MKTDWIKRVKVCGQLMEVTCAAPKIYQISFLFDVGIGYEEIFYKGFKDEDDVRRYCTRVQSQTDHLSAFFYEFVTAVKF